jgi:prevent-host-death family protein
MAEVQTLSASEFKARCLDVLDQVGRRQVERVVITKRGRVVAVLVPPEVEAEQVERLHGLLRGSVTVPEGLDLTAPVAEPFDAERGDLHR